MQSIMINRLNSLDKIRDRQVKELEKAGENLESVRTLLKFKQEGDKDKLKKYLDARTEFILLRRKLQDALIESIATQLERFDSDLEAGINNLNKELEKLEKTTAVLQTIDRVTGILSRIIFLAR